MAIVKEALESRLLVVVQTGTNELGQPVLRTRSFSGLKTDALDSDIYDVAVAIGNLQQFPLTSVHRVDEGELINQP